MSGLRATPSTTTTIIRHDDLRRVRRERRAHRQLARAAAREHGHLFMCGERASRWFGRNGIPRKTHEAVATAGEAMGAFLTELGFKAMLSMRGAGKSTLTTQHIDLAARTMGFDPCHDVLHHKKQKRLLAARARAAGARKAGAAAAQ